MRNAGWSMVVLCLISGFAMAQQQPTQPRPGTQPGAQPGGQPGAVRPGQPGAVRPGQPANQPGANQPGPPHQGQHGDQEIAQMIVGSNRNEVEVAKFAMDKLQSNEAKEIATMLIKDHTEAINKFSKFAGVAHATGARSGEAREGREGAREGRRDENRNDDDASAKRATNPSNAGANAGNTGAGNARTNTTPGGTAGVATPSSGNAAGNTTAQNQSAGTQNQPAGQPHTALRPVSGGGLNWAAVHQEVCDQSLAATKKELSKYSGNEFDKAFLGHQIAGHMMMVTKLKVLKNHASSQLASEIDGAISTTESHLKQIERVMDEKKDEKSDSKR